MAGNPSAHPPKLPYAGPAVSGSSNHEGKIEMKKSALLPFVLLLAGLLAFATAQAKTLGYPDMENASFLVEIPDDWTVEPGESVGDYVHVNSESGVYLAFRTVEASDNAMTQAIQDSIAFLQENYKNVKVGDPVEVKQAGQDAFLMDGTGKDSEGASVVFRMAWVALNDGNIGEVWFVAPADDKDGINAAGAALSSFRAP